MANRRISELPELPGDQVAEEDLLTVVHVFEVDPTLKNKKITVSGFRTYLTTKYIPVTGGTISSDLIIGGNLTVSGTTNVTTITGTSQATFSGIIVQNNLTATGTISGATITGNNINAITVNAPTGIFTTYLSGATITGTTVNATTGVFQSLTTSAHTVTGNLTVTGTISGTTITGNTGRFTTLTGGTGVFTTGVFTNTLSGATITGITVNATTGVFVTLTATNLTFSSATISGNFTVLGSGHYGSGLTVSGTLSGTTVTGNTGQFTNITGSTLAITTASGATPAIVCSGVVSGDASGFIIQGPLIILP